MFLRPQATGCPAPRRMVAHRYRCSSAGYLGGREGAQPLQDAENPPARSHNRTGGFTSTPEPLVQEQRRAIRLSLSLRSQQAPPPSTHREARPHGAEEIRAGGPVIYPQKLGIQSVRIPARSRTTATCRRLPRANHHPVNPQQAAEPIGAS